MLLYKVLANKFIGKLCCKITYFSYNKLRTQPTRQLISTYRNNDYNARGHKNAPKPDNR